MKDKTVLLSKEQRRQGFYFGGYEDGWYLKYRKDIVKIWSWSKPSQQQVDAEIKGIEQENR